METLKTSWMSTKMYKDNLQKTKITWVIFLSVNSQQYSRIIEEIVEQESNNIKNDTQQTKWNVEMNTHIVRNCFTAIKTDPNTYRRATYRRVMFDL